MVPQVFMHTPIHTTSAQPALEGSYIKILNTGCHPATETDGPHRTRFSATDLDEIARNYPPADGKKAALGVEKDWPGAQRLGEVESLRRDGDSLLAKVANVDPRLAELHRDGAFKRASVTLERTPQGHVLRRVGLVKDGSNSLIEQLHRGHFSRHEVDGADFSECPSVRQLKKMGKWTRFFDEVGVPAFCRLLEADAGTVRFGEGTSRADIPLAQAWVEFIQCIFPLVDSYDLDREARRQMSTRGVSYSEALALVNAERVEMIRAAQFSEIPAQGCSGVELHREAQRVSQANQISYCDALQVAVAEHPELTRR